MDLLTSLLDFLSAYDSYTEEYLTMFDLAGWAALLVFVGGLAFWLILMFALMVGLVRGIKRGALYVYDLVSPVSVDLELAHAKPHAER